jgi:hypothetical protein
MQYRVFYVIAVSSNVLLIISTTIYSFIYKFIGIMTIPEASGLSNQFKTKGNISLLINRSSSCGSRL